MGTQKRRESRPWSLAVLVLPALFPFVSSGCSDSTALGAGTSPYLLTLNATYYQPPWGVRYTCSAAGRLESAQPFPASFSGTVEFEVLWSAEESRGSILADTPTLTHPLSVTLPPDGNARVELPLGLGEMVNGSQQDFSIDGVVAAGGWSCPNGFPFADRDELVPPVDDPPWGLTGMWILARLYELH